MVTPDCLLDTPIRFFESEKLLALFFVATRDPKIWKDARNDPHNFLRLHDVIVPERLELTFAEKPDPRMPAPDHDYFTVRLFRCRRYWAPPKKDNEGKTIGYEEVEVCHGFELVPHPTGPGERRCSDGELTPPLRLRCTGVSAQNA